MSVCNRHVIFFFFSFWAGQYLDSLESFFKQCDQTYIKNKHKLDEGGKEANAVHVLLLHLQYLWQTDISTIQFPFIHQAYFFLWLSSVA